MRRSVLLMALVSLAVLLASGVALAVVPSAPAAGEASAAATAEGPDAALERALQELAGMEGGPPGAIAVVQRGHDREVHAFGVSNIEMGLPMRSPDDRMPIPSAAMAFSGAVALSLDDTIGERLSDLPKKPPCLVGYHPQAAFKPHQRPAGLFRQPRLIERCAGEPHASASAGGPALLRLRAQPQETALHPATQYKYSNTNNIAVGLMVEDATGRTYEGQLQEQVYGPLGLRRTALPAGPNLREPFIHAYDLSERPPQDLSEFLAAGWASGA